MTKKAKPKPVEPLPKPDPSLILKGSSRSGVNLSGDTVNVGGDVVGHDKTTTFDQRSQQVGTQYNIAGDYIAASVPAISLLHQLPPPPPDFTGRSAELFELIEKFEQGVTISGLQGQGGVGKTALALKLAEHLI